MLMLPDINYGGVKINYFTIYSQIDRTIMVVAVLRPHPPTRNHKASRVMATHMQIYIGTLYTLKSEYLHICGTLA